ncbi:hypothetical protein [Nonomuraea zeae]|uniref:hypothetical protein n=1 Tax=Nonomuraea zeae TaxID=1642303 RepID=UPI0036149A6F
MLTYDYGRSHEAEMNYYLVHSRLRDLDAWGRPLVQAHDGHCAWSCNNRQCEEHPASLYGAN